MISPPESLSIQLRPLVVHPKSEVHDPALAGTKRDCDSYTQEDLHRIFGRGIHFFLNRAGVPVSHQSAIVAKCFIVVQDMIRSDSSFPSSSIPKLLLSAMKSLAAGPVALPVKPALVEKARMALSQLSDQGREVLVSYFRDGQTQSEICNRLGISDAEFQRYKSDAKVAFAQASSNL